MSLIGLTSIPFAESHLKVAMQGGKTQVQISIRDTAVPKRKGPVDGGA